MIIQCENCKTKFRLDESLLKEEGSKVRCSICKHTFMVFPPEKPSVDESLALSEEDFQETVAIDSEAVDEHAKESAEPELREEIDFERAFESALEEKEIEVEIGAVDLEGYEPGDFEKEAFGEAAGEEQAPGPEPERIEGAGEEAPSPLEAKEPPAPKKSRIGLVILIIFFIVAAGAAAIVYFAPQMIPESLSFLKQAEKKTQKDLGVRRLLFKEVTGSFINSDLSGQLFIVKGMVVNDYPKPRSFILVKATILDDKGQIVKSKQAYAGNVFTEEELKKLSLDVINKALNNPRGKNNSNVKIASGGTIPFMIVFHNLPANLSEFTVEAVSSSPAR